MKNVRINNQIRVPEVRLIDETGEQVGVISSREALRMAEERGYDLVEISPQAQPPVAKLIDWDKYRYELKKQEDKQKKKQKTIEVKTIRLRMKIGEHDLNTKANQARKFLEKGNKVKVSLMFRGREVVHKGLGVEILNKFFEKVQEVGQIETPPTFAGREFTMILTDKK